MGFTRSQHAVSSLTLVWTSATPPIEDPPESIIGTFFKGFDFSQMWKSFGIAKNQQPQEGCKKSNFISNFYQFS
jgi:hypothetical protein